MREKRRIERILVAVKPENRGLPLAASHARLLAEPLGAEIRLVSCVFDSVVESAVPGGDPAADALRSQLVDNEQAELERLAATLRDWGATVSTRVRWDAPAYQGILGEVEEWKADLLVVGVHEPGRMPHTRLTDTDWQLMRLCPCPLLLVKNPSLDAYHTILAAVDPLHRHAEPSGLDRAVLETAAAFKDAVGAHLHVVNAYPNPNDYEFVSAIEILPGVFYGTENIESLHRNAVEDLLREAGVTHARIELRPGGPADVIVAVADEREADLVVLGSVERSRFRAGILGTTAEPVIADVASNVLVVKPLPEAD